MSARISQIKQRLLATDPAGPWKTDDRSGDIYAEASVGALSVKKKVVETKGWSLKPANKEFIAHSWADVKDMVDIIEILEVYVAWQQSGLPKEEVDLKFAELRSALHKFKRRLY